MATVPTQIRIDENLKKQATEIFQSLGLDMSSAINVFLRQAVLRGGLPFNVELPNYKKEVIEAMNEAKKISRDENIKAYTDVRQMFEDILNAED
ncbi:MAG: type II toxin-antitoxin system RelB/DinJ family antitoxin [Clostridia bacterium]|nr:type II toxin-antitoxin system RelB/DinJ family antitoxin [Clostridia bacterium]